MKILLYYKFVEVLNPQKERDEHFALCASLGLKGRILIAPEGINGTVCGTNEACDAYMSAVAVHPLFAGTEFKQEYADGPVFHKLHVRVKPELVNFGVAGAPKPWQRTGRYIEPNEMHSLLKNTPENVVFLDGRSLFEYEVGRFKGALPLEIQYFRETPKLAAQLEKFKDKTVVTYCTGGIRCEKLTGWLMDLGFEDVAQLRGGIVRYGQETGGEFFEGTCFVFDERLVSPVNRVNPTVVGKCKICAAPTEKYVNCANAACNDLFLICPECIKKYEGACSESCYQSPKRRTWNGAGMYLRGVDSKKYVR